MKPRPLYRWKSFWFGALTLAFMEWASVDSLRYLSDITFSLGGSSFEICRVNQATVVLQRPFSPSEISGFAHLPMIGWKIFSSC